MILEFDDAKNRLWVAWPSCAPWQNLRNKNTEDLTESIGVVPAKYSPKVKLERENFYNSRVPMLGNYVYLDLWGLWGFYSSVELTLDSWWRRHFLVEKILINTGVLWEPFLVRISLIMVGRRMQDISILGFLETSHAAWLHQAVSLGPVYFRESICHLASPSRSWTRPLALWLVECLGRLFWWLRTNVCPCYLCPFA